MHNCDHSHGDGDDSYIPSSQVPLYFFWFAKRLLERHSLLPLTTNKMDRIRNLTSLKNKWQAFQCKPTFSFALFWQWYHYMVCSWHFSSSWSAHLLIWAALFILISRMKAKLQHNIIEICHLQNAAKQIRGKSSNKV